MPEIPGPEPERPTSPSVGVPKSPAVLQAQVAAFAKEKLTRPADQGYLIDHVVEVAASPPAEFDELEAHPGYSQPADAKDAYVQYLRESAGAAAPEISVRAEILERYENFRADIDTFIADLGSKHAIAHGGYSNAYHFEHDGRVYILRVPIVQGAARRIVDDHLRAAVVANDIAHLEHIVTASYETGVTIAGPMPGKNFEDIQTEDIEQITLQQLKDLVATIRAAEQAELVIDPKASNMFYDPEAGFGMIDFELITAQLRGTRYHSQTAEMLNWWEDLLLSGHTTPTQARRDAGLAALSKLRTVLESEFSGQQQEELLAGLDYLIRNRVDMN